MKKNLIILCLLMMIMMPCVKGKDYSGGTSGVINPSGSGGWSPHIVAIRISIVSSSGTLEDVRYFTNNNVFASGAKCFSESKPKTHQTKKNDWVSCSKIIDDGVVYQSEYFNYSVWNPNDISINIHKGLKGEDNNYTNLKGLLNFEQNGEKIFNTISPGDFIIVEPMAHFDGYTGTAYELATSFLDTSKCGTDGSFCWDYAGAAFSGSRKYPDGGFFYSTIFLEEEVTVNNVTLKPYAGDTGIYYSCNHEDGSGRCTNGENQIKRIDEFKRKTGGLGIGILDYNKIFNGSIEITKYKSGTSSPLSGAGFTLYSDSDCSNVIVAQKTTNSAGKITFDKLNTRKYYYKETTTPAGYQEDDQCYPIDVTNGKKTTKTVYNTPIDTKGSLKINIKKYGTNTPISSYDNQVQFQLYNGDNCNENSTYGDPFWTSSGYKQFSNLPSGTYSIKEISKRGTYSRATNPDNDCVVPSLSIVADKTTSIDVFYDTACGIRLTELLEKNLDATAKASQLINLYNEVLNEGQDYKNLLNFSSPDCSSSTETDVISIDGCLQAHYGSNVEYNNLSNYKILIKDGDNKNIGFCSIKYELKNKLNNTSIFYGTAGQLVIKKVIESGINKIQFKNGPSSSNFISLSQNYIAEAESTMRCYTTQILTTEILNLDNNNNIKLDSTNFKNVGFGNNSGGTVAEILPPVSSTNGTVNLSAASPTKKDNGLYEYEVDYIRRYGLNSFYLDKITGKYIGQNKTNTSTQTPVYGILSKFNVTTSSIPFSVGEKSNNTVCSYNVTSQLIDTKIKLEFRTIDTSNPFNRNTKLNWCDGTDCVENNNTVQTYITNRTNSYGFKNGSTERQQPIYKITLTPNDIKLIRKYNKDHPYDNYHIHCWDENPPGVVTCRNAFLENLKKGFLRKYEYKINSGIGGVVLRSKWEEYGELTNELWVNSTHRTTFSWRVTE